MRHDQIKQQQKRTVRHLTQSHNEKNHFTFAHWLQKKNEKRKMEFCENCRVEFGALFVLFQVRDNKSQLQNENKIRKKTWTNGDWSKQSVENWMWRNEREVDFCFILFLCSVALLKSKLTCYGWRRISQIEMDSFCVWQTTKSSHKKVIIKT